MCMAAWLNVTIYTHICHVPGVGVGVEPGNEATIHHMYLKSEPPLQLNLTHDPIADMINAVCSDVISFASQRT